MRKLRLGNAVGMGLGFLAFDRGNALAADLPLWGKVVAYPATGFAGGLVMSEGSQLVSNGKFASADQALQSAVQGMTLNSVMPLAQEGMRRFSEHRAAVTAAKEDAATTKDGGYKIVIQRDGKGGTLDQLAGRDGDQSLAANEIKLNQNASSLAQLSQSYSDWLKENQVKYPNPEEFSKLTPNEIVNRGFYHPDATNLDQLKLDEQFGHDDPRPLPNADVVASEVAKSMAGMPMAKPTGDLTLGEWNGEFLNADKANYFQKTYMKSFPATTSCLSTQNYIAVESVIMSHRFSRAAR